MVQKIAAKAITVVTLTIERTLTKILLSLFKLISPMNIWLTWRMKAVSYTLIWGILRS